MLKTTKGVIIKFTIILFFALFATTQGLALAPQGLTLPTEDFDTANIPIEDVAISQTFSDKNDVVLKAQVIYPNGCYLPLQQLDETGRAENRIVIEHNALIRNTFCTQAVVTRQVHFDLKEYTAGVYKVFDGTTGSYLGELIISTKGKHKFFEFGEL